MSTVIRKLTPRVFRPLLGRMWRGMNHTYQTRRLFGSRAGFVPPLHLMHDGPIGYEEFKDNGEEFMRYYVEIGGLRPDEHMLDVASGIGRKTLPLVAYLNKHGSYQGIDIVKSGVEWCREKYTAQYPNFRFQQIDVYNKHYNPEGCFKASEYRFPFPDEHFDFVVLNSVFTHMLTEEVENYLSEIARVLKPGGRSLITFFLLNAESLDLIESGRSTVDLQAQLGPARTVSRETPELAVGYDMAFVSSLYEQNGLEVSQPIHFGSWCGRSDYLSYQDIVLSVKPAISR
jgi:ubiquinone/menaquinone biosynthesis C-methylase UbiE